MFLGYAKRTAFVFALVAVTGLVLGTQSWAAGVKMSWYGNQHFRFVSPGGKVVLINPWVKGNKDAPFGVDHFKKGDVDLILPTAGHGDDQGQSVEIAARTGATIFVMAELGTWMANQIVKFGGSKKQVYRAAVNGRYRVGDVLVEIIQAVHGNGISPAKGMESHQYGGPAAGFVLTFDDGLRVLMAGSTGLSLNLQLYGQFFKPHVAMLPIMGRFMMNPDEAAYGAKLLMTDNPNLKMLIPQHFRVKGAPPWMGTPAQFEAEVKKLNLGLKVLTPKVGEEYTLTK